MSGRVITVVLVIKDKDSAKEFWDAHLARREIHGCTVKALAEGDKIKECEHLEEELEDVAPGSLDDDRDEEDLTIL